MRGALPAFLAALSGLVALLPPAPAAGEPAAAAGGPLAQLRALVGRAVVKLAKCAVTVQDVHPFSFRHAEVLPPWVDFAVGQVLAAAPAAGGGEGSHVAQLLIQCMLLLQRLLACPAYKAGVTEPHLLPPGGEAALNGARRELAGTLEAALPPARREVSARMSMAAGRGWGPAMQGSYSPQASERLSPS